MGQTHGGGGRPAGPWGTVNIRQGARSLLQAAESLRNFKQRNARMEAVLQADDSGSWVEEEGLAGKKVTSWQEGATVQV